MKENKKVINEKNYNSRTKRGNIERLKKVGDGNTIITRKDKERMREAYKNDNSAFNPDNPNCMKVATVRARRVIPLHRQNGLSQEKLNEIRLILIVDSIRNKIVYLNLTKYKKGQENNNKYIIVDAILDNNKQQAVDIIADNLDYSNRRTSKLNISNVRIQFHIKLSNKTKQAIYRAVNARIKNIIMSKRLKQSA